MSSVLYLKQGFYMHIHHKENQQADTNADSLNDCQPGQLKPLLLWSVHWLLMLSACNYALTQKMLADSSWQILFVVMPSLAAAMVARAYWQHIRRADELARAIELKALATSLSAGFICWPLFNALQKTDVSLSGWPNLLIVIMVASYGIALIAGWRHYR